MGRPYFWAPMHRIALAAAALLLIATVQAQRPWGPRGDRPAIGRIYGRVLDAASHKPAEFATTSLFNARNDSLVGGALVATNGDFSIEHLPFGAYKLRVAFIGYKTLEQPVNVTPDHVEQDLGNLQLEPDNVELKAAVVTAERSQTQLQVDRRVYNVEKDLSVRGGTAVDVMKNVPGLSVDADENVQLRNAAPLILVDGRPTVLALEQIPADEIERVEVITNPGAAFDASSSGGIINVVLKKSTRPGYNGQVQFGAGTHERYVGNASLNVKEGRWSWNLSGNGGYANNLTRASTLRDQYTEGVFAGRFDQSGPTRNKRANFGGRLGAEYRINNRSTVTASANVRTRNYDGNDDLGYTNTDGGGALVTSGDQVNTSTSTGTDASVQAGFRRKTIKEGREWSTDLTYNRSRRDNTSSFTTHTYDADGSALVGGLRAQNNTGGTNSDQWTWQFDMTDPRAKGKLEYGLRSNTRLERSNFSAIVGTDTSAAALDPTLSNDYRITDLVNAAYVSWTRPLNERWSLQAGLRAEQSWFQADVHQPGVNDGTSQRFSYRYPDGTKDLVKALFPSLYFSRKWEGTREFQVNLSRKIGRPNFFQVMPFILFSDARNVRQGNPTLAPEFIDLAEVNHLLPFKNPRNNWLTSVFLRHTSDVITTYAYPLATDPNILVSTFINGRDNWTYGWENTMKLELSKLAQITLGGTVQYVEISAGSGPTALSNTGWQVNGKANFTMRLPKSWSFQVNGEYEGRRPLPQGYSVANGDMDVSLAKDLGDHWSVQALVNDVFYSQQWGTVLDTPVLYQLTERRRDMRFVRLTVTWKFGKQDASLFKRDKSQPRRDPGAPSGEGDF